MTRSIVFLSDFGFRNEWVGVCHAVIDKVAPGCPVVDLSHGIAPLDVTAGALLLARLAVVHSPRRDRFGRRRSERGSGPRHRGRSRGRQGFRRPGQRSVECGLAGTGWSEECRVDYVLEHRA